MNKRFFVTLIIASFTIMIYTGCKQSNHISEESKKEYLNMGIDIVKNTQTALAKNLTNAINNLGTAQAVDYCNVHAIPITDTMSDYYHVQIKRVSDLPRNPKNQANAQELEYIHLQKENLKNNKETIPKLNTVGDNNVGYFPIVTNQFCMQCHGEKYNDILPETYQKILEKYPNDKATGYSTNQIRGIWVVTFPKENTVNK